MLDANLEFSICQYLDGQLPEAERVALEQHLAIDPEAREALEQYRKLNAAVKQVAPLPEIRWDRLAEQLSATVAAEESAARFRIDTWLRAGVKLAVAAMVVVAFGLFARMYPGNPTTPTRNDPVSSVALAEVTGPTINVAGGPAVAEIEIRPPTLAQRPQQPADYYAVEDLVYTTPRIVVIASESESGQDSFLPYR